MRRDRRTLALLIVVPAVVLTLLGLLLRYGSGSTAVAVVNEDHAALSTPLGQVSAASLLVQMLEQSKDLQVARLSRDEAERQLRSGQVKAVLLFDQGFSQRIAAERRVKVDLLFEGSNPQTTAAVNGSLGRALAQAQAQMAGVLGGADGPTGLATLEIQRDFLYGGEQLDVLDYFAPVFIGYFAFFFVFLLTSVSFLRERSQGTMERLMASPLSRGEIVLGYMLGFSVFAVVQAALILGFAILVLRIHYAGNLLIVFMVQIILTIGAVNLGIFLSTFAKNELQVVQFIPVVIIPQALLCGTIYPLEDMPELLRWISAVLPLTYANDALRAVMIRGANIISPMVLVDILVLLAFAALMIPLGALTLRRQVA
jgi:ABC-2 type transport system permease protein